MGFGKNPIRNNYKSRKIILIIDINVAFHKIFLVLMLSKVFITLTHSTETNFKNSQQFWDN